MENINFIDLTPKERYDSIKGFLLKMRNCKSSPSTDLDVQKFFDHYLRKFYKMPEKLINDIAYCQRAMKTHLEIHQHSQCQSVHPHATPLYALISPVDTRWSHQTGGHMPLSALVSPFWPGCCDGTFPATEDFTAMSLVFPVFRLQSAFAKKTPSPRRRKRYKEVTGGFHYQLHASHSVNTGPGYDRPYVRNQYGTVRDQFGTSSGPVRDQYGISSAPVRDQYGTSTEPVRDQYGTSTGPVRDQFGTSTGPRICTKRSNDGGAGEQVSRLKGRKIAQLDRSTCSAGPSTTHPPTTIFALNTYCWDKILSYLCLSEQLHLAASNHQLKMLIEALQHRYNIIEESVTGSIGESELQQLLDIVREHVISYESPLDPLSGQDRHLWMLRDYCPDLRHLKMSFRRPRWHDLLQLKNLTSLHASLHFSNAGLYKNFIISLSALPHLKKLKLEATSYTGDGLHALDKLEYLEMGNQHGFDASILASCCMTMKKLCHLNMGENTANLEGEDFRLWHCDINASFIEKLIQKPGTPLESLILVGDTLEPEQSTEEMDMM
ncbi:GM24702 [Drosophila sechellia]|uniref:GM24702 n=1 Tax=Drosophila sechellia TaxID=7238 RepID=B4HF03_DROSE|nr:GM24702 [Drosophila sechellia]